MPGKGRLCGLIGGPIPIGGDVTNPYQNGSYIPSFSGGSENRPARLPAVGSPLPAKALGGEGQAAAPLDKLVRVFVSRPLAAGRGVIQRTIAYGRETKSPLSAKAVGRKDPVPGWLACRGGLEVIPQRLQRLPSDEAHAVRVHHR